MTGEIVPLIHVAVPRLPVACWVKVLPFCPRLVSAFSGCGSNCFVVRHITRHCIESDDGVEILIHVGIDTVKRTANSFPLTSTWVTRSIQAIADFF